MALSQVSSLCGFAALVLGCRDAPRHPVEAGPATPSVATAAPTPTPTPTREAEQPPVPSGDAGLSGCTTRLAPTKLSRPGPFALGEAGDDVVVYVAEGGAPAIVARLDRAASLRDEPTSGGRAQSPGCASAGSRAFCMDTQGVVRRYGIATPPKADVFSAHARPGTRLAATEVTGHAVVSYLRDHATSEGVVMEALIADEDGAEQRLSEDGAGATSVALTGSYAVYVDARRSMSPVHVRKLGVSPKLTLGPDVVVYVAGSAEPSTQVSATDDKQGAFVLLPIAHDLSFGMGIIEQSGEPQMDAPVVWSDYPNGVDPAPVAAKGPYVARVRPSAPKYGSSLVLELGRIDGPGTFVPLGVLPTQGRPADVALDLMAGDLTLAYTDGSGGWITRVHCSAP